MLRKLVLIFIFLTVKSTISIAQKRNANWCFGDSAGLKFKQNGVISFTTSILTRGSCVSISDSNANLQFYAETFSWKTLNFGINKYTYVYNKEHSKMIGGDTIIGEGWYQELVIIPMPANDSLYYLFSIGVTAASEFGLFYSIINMHADSGRGEVIQKNVQLNNLQAADGITAIKHGNGRDWWLVFRRWDVANDEYYFYEITPNGINATSQNIGTMTYNGFIHQEFSKSGDHLLAVGGSGWIELYDFDRCTGILSNPVTIEPEPTGPPYGYYFGAELSANGRYMYISSNDVNKISYVAQYDLQAANIAASKDTIFLDSVPIKGLALKRGPDDKIYYSCVYYDGVGAYPYPDSLKNMYTQNLSVINNPDTAAPYCNFSPFSVWLGGNETYWGLPNNPDYDMGPLVGSACDTLSVNLTPGPSPLGEGSLFLTYISAWEKLFINAQNLKGRNVTIAIYDARGSLMVQEFKGSRVNAGYFTMNVDCAGWASGLYVVHLQTEKEVLNKKLIKN